jgi:hypothetical protein
VSCHVIWSSPYNFSDKTFRTNAYAQRGRCVRRWVWMGSLNTSRLAIWMLEGIPGAHAHLDHGVPRRRPSCWHERYHGCTTHCAHPTCGKGDCRFVVPRTLIVSMIRQVKIKKYKTATKLNITQDSGDALLHSMSSITVHYCARVAVHHKDFCGFVVHILL